MARGRSVTRHSGSLGWLYAPDEPVRPKKSDSEQQFNRLALHGTVGTIAWGYRTAAVLSSWRVAKSPKGEWTLTATAERIDDYCLRQTQPTPLFTAPRAQASHWCWPIQELRNTGNRIQARLGPPEF